MTEQEQKNLRCYCAFLLKEYGFHFYPDNPVLPALYVIHREMQLTTDSNKALASLVNEAVAKIKPTVFNFNSEEAALKFQVGIAVKWLLIGGLGLIFSVLAIWYWSMVNKVDEANVIIQTSGNMGGLMRRVKKDNEGYFFIDFTAAEGDSIQYFKEYQKLGEKTVRVYIGNKSNQVDQ